MTEEKKLCEKINRDTLKKIIIGVAIFAAIVLIFGTGMFVGGMKARFSYQWLENYHKNFAGPRAGFLGDWRGFPRGDFIESHGTFGEIIKISAEGGSASGGNDSDLIIKGRSDVEKIILISEETTVEKGRDTIKKEELKVGDRVVIIGSPNDEGQIEAKLIRIFK